MVSITKQAIIYWLPSFVIIADIHSESAVVFLIIHEEIELREIRKHQNWKPVIGEVGIWI